MSRWFALRLKSGDHVQVVSDEIEEVVVGVVDDPTPNRIVIGLAGEEERCSQRALVYRVDDLACLFLRGVRGQERLDPDPL